MNFPVAEVSNALLNVNEIAILCPNNKHKEPLWEGLKDTLQIVSMDGGIHCTLVTTMAEI